jgi:NAD(P)H dehydrogenase (quinone)
VKQTANMDDVLRTSSIRLLQVGEALGIRNLDPESGKIFVTGGVGVIGHRVALRLLRAGYPDVRLGAHHASSLEEENKMGAEIADFAWDREETYESALKGVKSVLCTVAYTKEWQKHFPVFLKACEKAQVRHFVKLSFYHARIAGDPFQEIPLVKAHGDCDELLIESLSPTIESFGHGDMDVAVDFAKPHMSYTILYASHFMSNAFTMQGKELHNSANLATFFGASGNRGVNYVSPNDIAEVAVRVLLEPRQYYNKELTLTGPQAITDQQVADLISKHLNKPVMYVDQPLREFKTEICMSGDPEWMVQDLVCLEKIKATGTEDSLSFVTHDVEKVCGHEAESFEDYLRETDYMTVVERGAEPELKPLKPTVY